MKKGTIDFWDKEEVKKLVAETCPSLVSDEEQPVYYCKHCLSLGVYAGDFGDTCLNCGSTDIEKSSMRVYDELYFQKFGKKLFNLD